MDDSQQGGNAAAQAPKRASPQPSPKGSRPPSPGKSSKRTSKSKSPDAPSRSPPGNAPDGPKGDEADDGAEQGTLEPGGPEEEDEFLFDEVDVFSDSTSVSSSIYQHTFQHGRRYHKFRHGRYPIPNDEREQGREDLLHAMMLEATDGKLFFAPVVENPQRIIDLGTGTGIWAIEMGDKYPSAEVVGLDLSPIQPAWVPPNVQFLVDDVEDTWEEKSDYDFVHLRNMIPILKSPVKLLKQALANMKPGAWLELQDVDGEVHCDDGTLPPDWPLVRFCQLLVEAFGMFGTNAHAARSGRQYLEEAGFVNIRHHAVKLPYGPWPSDKTMRVVGSYYRIACEEMFPVVGAIHLPMLGWSEAEMQVLFAQCRNGMRDPNVHAYGKMHFWSGQKPLED